MALWTRLCQAGRSGINFHRLPVLLASRPPSASIQSFRRACSNTGMWINKVLFKRHLLLTNIGLSGLCFCFGDVTCQWLEGVKFSLERTGRITMAGFGLGIPIHFWYQFLDGYLAGVTRRIVMKKVILDMLVFAPPFAALFLCIMGYMSGLSKEEVKADVSHKWIYLYSLDWAIWPLANGLNFAMVTPPYRVLYICLITYMVDIVISYIYHCDKKEAQIAIEEVMEDEAEE